MRHICSTILRCWGTQPTFRLSGYLWIVGMFSVLAALEANQIGLFLVPPFGATLTILMLLPDAAIAQPYALIAGSVVGAAVGTGISFFGHTLGMAVLAMIAAFIVISLIRAYHPPGVALAIYPILLHPGRWFPLLVASFHFGGRGISGSAESMEPRLAQVSEATGGRCRLASRPLH